MISVRPATIFDLAELGGAKSLADWITVKALWRRGTILALCAGHELVALGWFMPLEGGNAEAGFNFAPNAGPHMLGIARALQLTLRDAPYPAIVTECSTVAGARIARLAGFKPFGAHGMAGEIWAYGGPSDRSKRAAAAAADGHAGQADRCQPAPVAGAHGGGAG